MRQQRARCDMMQVVFFFGRDQRGPAPYTKRNAMQRSKFDIGRADAGAGGMSMISGSGGASGMGASSSSSDASAMAQSTGSSGAGSGSMCLEKNSSREWSAAASATASLKWASLWARNGRYPVVQALFSSQRSVTSRAAHSAEEHKTHSKFVISTVPNGRASKQDRHSKFVILDIHHACKGQIHGLKKPDRMCWSTSHSPPSCPGKGCQDHGGDRC